MKKAKKKTSRVRGIRIPDDLWKRAERFAATWRPGEDTSVSALMRHALEQMIAGRPSRLELVIPASYDRESRKLWSDDEGAREARSVARFEGHAYGVEFRRNELEYDQWEAWGASMRSNQPHGVDPSKVLYPETTQELERGT